MPEVAIQDNKVKIFDGIDETIVPLPYDGIRPWAYDFDISVSSRNFLLVYSGEFRIRNGGLISQSEPGLDGDVNWVGANVAQLYTFEGVALGEPIWITSQTNQGHRPGVGALSDGSYLVVWQTNNPNGYPELGNMIGYIVARHVSADGTKVGETFIVATGRNLLAEGVRPTVNEVNGEVFISWDEYSSQFDRSSITRGASGDISKKINGSEQDDILVSFEGNDEIFGHGGSDQLKGGAGIDYLSGGSGADNLDGGNGNDTLLGGSGDDYIDAGDGDDFIVGGDGAGNDIYIGGSGIDTIKYTSALAGITVNLSASSNHAKSTLSGDRAGIGVDQLSGIENIIAGNYNDVLTGNASRNRIDAGKGNDTLNGGTGKDTLIGGLGNDTYITDGGDTITEALNAGTDTVRSSVSHTLGANLENLTLTGSGAINGTGNTLNNVITGNSGNNILDGGTGADSLIGGTGNDTYVVDNVSDRITEAASAGTDTVQSSVTYTLAVNVENLTLTGSGVINGTGNSLNNVITGNSGNNTLSGGTGTDTLTGGSGSDLLYGGADSVRDVFIFNSIAESKTGSTRDKVYDFRTTVDDLDLRGIDANTKVAGDQGFSFSTTTARANSVWYKAANLDGNTKTKEIIVYGDATDFLL
jgi:Ca2+-binding RTX toxin-like protein